MRVIAKSTIKKFQAQPAYRDAKGPLESGYEAALKANWASPQAIKADTENSRIWNKNRVVLISAATNTGW